MCGLKGGKAFLTLRVFLFEKKRINDDNSKDAVSYFS